MKAIILAAGRSRRLLPVTQDTPKCLLPVGGEALIDRLLRILRNCGVDEVVMVTGFQAKKLEKHVLQNNQGSKFVFVKNLEYANTHPAYSLYLVKEHLAEDVLYLNSDVLCDEKILAEIIEHKLHSITAVRQTEWDEEEVNVVTNENNLVEKIGKQICKEESRGEFIGVTKLGKDFNQFLIETLQDLESRGDRNKFAADAINLAIGKGGELYVHDVTHYKACEIDTIEDYQTALEIGNQL